MFLLGFSQKQRNCQGSESQSKETQNCFPMYFLTNLWLYHLPPSPSKPQTQRQMVQGKEDLFYKQSSAKLLQGRQEAGRLLGAPRGLTQKRVSGLARYLAVVIPPESDCGSQTLALCPHAQGPGQTPSFSPPVMVRTLTAKGACRDLSATARSCH